MTQVLTPEHAEMLPLGVAAETVARARAAQQEWKRVPMAERARRMRGLRAALVRRLDDVVETVNTEVGKPRVEGLIHEVGIVAAMLSHLERKGEGVLRPRRIPGWPFIHKRGERLYEPYGVVGVIAPANFPFMLSAVPTCAALMAGNAVVLKPSERAPGTARLLGSLMREAIPEHPDLLMILQGGPEIGEALVRSRPDKLVFVGGTSAGYRVATVAAEQFIPLVLELGANDAAIVCEDANLERAARALVWGATLNSGQVCMSVQRALVHEQVYDRFVELAHRQVQRVRPGVEVGPLYAGGQARTIAGLVADAVRRGGRVLAGGEGGSEVPPTYPPTLIVDVEESSALHREEVFGPVLAITRVSGDEEALRVANASPYGLNASVWTADAERARCLATELRVGAVVINDVLSNMGMPMPYGGVGASGFGRLLGAEGLLEFVRPKSIATTWFQLGREPYWYPYSDRQYRLLRRAIVATFGVGAWERLRGALRRR